MSFYLKAIAGIGITGLALVGCNGSGLDGTGTFSLDVTDAPVDEATAVNVVFEGVDIIAANGTRVEITYDTPRSINLLDLQGGETASLLDGETLVAGDYEQIRLRVDADQGSSTSTIEFPNGPTESLFIPSGSQSGLKLVRGFTVPVNGSVSFTIDFDLRKSVVKTGGNNPKYILKPALRLVDNAEVGEISGTIAQATIDSINSAEPNACSSGMAVYVYEGANVTPDDVGGAGVEPISSAMVNTLDTGEFGYTAAFLVEGEYTVSFTCDAELDDPEADDTEVAFESTKGTTVVADSTVTVNF